MNAWLGKAPRPLTSAEDRLVRRLLAKVGGGEGLTDSLNSCLVIPINDGDMGSLRFVSNSETEEGRIMGICGAQLEFLDDGVPVIASLDLDQVGQLFELDIFKADFRPIRNF